MIASMKCPASKKQDNTAKPNDRPLALLNWTFMIEMHQLGAYASSAILGPSNDQKRAQIAILILIDCLWALPVPLLPFSWLEGN